MELFLIVFFALFLIGLLPVGVFLLGYRLVQRLACKAAARCGDRFVVQYGRAAKVGASFFWGLVLLCVGSELLHLIANGSDVQPIVRVVIRYFVMGYLCALGLTSLAATFFWRVEFDEESLYVFSPWRRAREILWSEVTGGVIHSRMFVGCLLLKSQSSGEIRFSSLLDGLGTLAEELEKRGLLPKEKSLGKKSFVTEY